DGIRDFHVTGVQTCALPISDAVAPARRQTLTLLRMAIQIMWRAPRPRPLARVGTSSTAKPDCRRLRVKAGLGLDDHTPSTPPGQIGRAPCRERAEQPAVAVG